METALLILILAAGDPASADTAKAVAEAMRGLEPKATIVLPPESAKLIAERGLKDADLVGRSEKPVLATAADLRLVLVRVERRDTGRDRVVEVELWSGGRSDRMSAVTGPDGDPTGPAAEGARRLLAEAAHDPAAAADRTDRAFVAGFVEREDWKGLIEAVAARPDASARLRHAAVTARLRLGDRDGAARDLAVLRTAFPQHPLTAAAAAAVEAAGDGLAEDALREARPADDGGNTLR